MQKYARSDTHFLLYIYDNLRNALLDRAGGESSIVTTCLERSQETALRVPEPEVYDHENGLGPGGWSSLMNKWGRVLHGTQLSVFKAVHAWRDTVARSEDESTRYVLPNHYLFQVAERVPADLAGLLGLFRPVPPLVRVRANELLETIRDAVKEAEGGGGSIEQSIDQNEVEVAEDEVTVRREKTSVNSKPLHENLWSRETPGEFLGFCNGS